MNRTDVVPEVHRPPAPTGRYDGMRRGLRAGAVLAVAVLAGCGGVPGGASNTSGSTSLVLSAVAPSSIPVPAGAVTVTVPDLGGAAVPSSNGPAVSSVEPAPVESSSVAAAESASESAAPSVAAPAGSSASEPAPAAPTPEAAPPSAASAPPAAGDGSTVPVTLANCPGCSVLATHAAVTGDLSAALVASGTGRALLLSVGTDGSVRGLINIPYGAEFPAPAGAMLPCGAQGRCVVSARQSDGRAILSSFELTGTGAWRDVSGNDAFPSATPEGRTVDLDGSLGIAVQDAAAGATVWMVFGWSGERYTVVGCSTETAADPGTVALDPASCLS